MHVHFATLYSTLHTALKAQGEGEHGDTGIGRSVASPVGGSILIALHCMKGFPVKPAGQVHTGLCSTTSQYASKPQVPGHGSMHLVLKQALFDEQSLSSTHSGLHPLSEYGSPKKSS